MRNNVQFQGSWAELRPIIIANGWHTEQDNDPEGDESGAVYLKEDEASFFLIGSYTVYGEQVTMYIHHSHIAAHGLKSPDCETRRLRGRKEAYKAGIISALYYSTLVILLVIAFFGIFASFLMVGSDKLEYGMNAEEWMLSGLISACIAGSIWVIGNQFPKYLILNR